MMGGEEKDHHPARTPGNGRPPRQENVSDAVISKLLKDFTSAELLPQSDDPSQSQEDGSKRSCSWHEIIASFKHLHVRRPDLKKQRRARKNSKKSNKGSANLLNLAVAAGNFQKPIVWPARLNECRKPSTGLLNPSRLKVPVAPTCVCDTARTWDKQVATSAIGCSCKQTRGKGHQARSQQISSVPFGHASGVSDLSFSSLCDRQGSCEAHGWDSAAGSSKRGAEGSDKLGACTSSNTSNNNKLRQQASQQHKGQRFAGQQLFTNSPLCPLIPSPELSCTVETSLSLSPQSAPRAIYAMPSAPTSLTSASLSSSTSSPGSAWALGLHRHHQPPPSSHAQQTTVAPPPGPGRSCSQEVRDMEETNVNELASYLEDLLYIPRKMSTMAEMMYA